jgi:PPE-repeat protein
VAAAVGQAESIGPLSVPPSWAGGAAGLNPTAQGAASLSALRTAEESTGPGGLLRGVPLSGAGRRGSGGFVHKYGFRYNVMPRPPAAG